MVLSVCLKQNVFCGLLNFMSTVFTNLGVSESGRIFEYVLQLVVGIGRPGAAGYCDRLGVPRSYFMLRQKYTKSKTISKYCAGKDVYSKPRSRTDADSCVKIAEV